MLTKAGAKLMDFGLAKPTFPIAVAGGRPIHSFHADDESGSLTSAALAAHAERFGRWNISVHRARSLAGSGGGRVAATSSASDACSTKRPPGVAPSRQVAAQRLTAILEKEPESIVADQPACSANARHVDSRMLGEGSSERIQSAHDIAMELRWIASMCSQPPMLNLPPRRLRAACRWLALLAAANCSRSACRILASHSTLARQHTCGDQPAARPAVPLDLGPRWSAGALARRFVRRIHCRRQ